MKKLLFIMLLMAGFLNVFSQQDPIEKKLKIKEIDPATLSMIKEMPGNKPNCNCEKNLIRDGNFNTVTTIPGSSDIANTSPIWKRASYSPQYTRLRGGCDSGFVLMWGNKTVGESIYQSGLSLQKGKCYTIKFNARFPNNTGANNPYVQLAVLGSASTTPGDPHPLSAAAAVSTPPIINTAWASYSMTITPSSNFTSLTFFPVNGNAQNDGDYVSWIQLDNICIQECCTIPDEKCNPKFSAASFTVNNQGNIIINVNPLITGGAQHYWGLLGASGLGDNTPIPLSIIISGGSFGLAISSTGAATHVGMGTGINASTSGYGYSYQGVALGQCFKITHYIKCCGTWYSQTNTYCTKLCTEVKEGGLSEVSPKETEKLEAAEAVKGQ